jgi:hypothetical protein
MVHVFFLEWKKHGKVLIMKHETQGESSWNLEA